MDQVREKEDDKESYMVDKEVIKEVIKDGIKELHEGSDMLGQMV